MSHVKCNDCECVFDERDGEPYTESTPSEAWGVRAVTRETFLACPECGSENVEDHDEDDDLNDELDDEPFDYEKIKQEAKEAQRNEFTEFLLEIAREPWKRQA